MTDPVRRGDPRAPRTGVGGPAEDGGLLVSGGGPLAERLLASLGAGWRHETARGVPAALAARGGAAASTAASTVASTAEGAPATHDAVPNRGIPHADAAAPPDAPPAGLVYLAASRGDPRRGLPDGEEVRALLAACAAAGVPRMVVVASAAIHEPSHLHPGMVAEEALRNRRTGHPVAAAWRRFEKSVENAVANVGESGAENTSREAGRGPAAEPLAAPTAGERPPPTPPVPPAPGVPPLRVTLLRAAPVPVPGGADPWSRWLYAPLAPTLLGFDPMVQLLAVDDLAGAVEAVLRRPIGADSAGGLEVFHVAPREPAPARRAVRSAGARRVAVPSWLWRLARPASQAAGEPAALRHPATVSAGRLTRATGFTARWTTLQAARRNRGEEPPPSPPCDPHGYDPDYRQRLGRTLFRFLERIYWRVEVHGTEHLPRQGAALLVGTHRGFQPWDGVMLQQAVLRETGRVARFLMHPTLVKFPFVAPYMTRIGGLVGSRENADRVLAAGGLLGVYPEGIRGAFGLLADAYRISPFFRDEFAELAIRHGVPVVPFATLGSAESFPIVGRLDWVWARRHTQWPYVPVTTPLPLPSKWHTLVLPPVDTAARFRPGDAEDPEAVARLAGEVREQLAAALARGATRRWRFFGGLPEDR